MTIGIPRYRAAEHSRAIDRVTKELYELREGEWRPLGTTYSAPECAAPSSRFVHESAQAVMRVSYLYLNGAELDALQQVIELTAPDSYTLTGNELRDLDVELTNLKDRIWRRRCEILPEFPD